MGRYFSLTLERPTIQNKSKPKANPRFKVNFGFLLAASLLILGVFYLLQVNNLSTRGYEIKKLEKKMTELKEVNTRLELESSSLKSIQNLDETVKILNLVPSTEVRHFKGKGYAYEQEFVN